MTVVAFLGYGEAGGILAQGLLAAGAGRAMGMLVLVMVMLYTWFITKTALRVTGVLATGLVILDFVVSIILNALTESMVR